MLAELRELLNKVRDIPRILGRLQNRLRNPRELGGVKRHPRSKSPIMACLDLLDSHLRRHGAETSNVRARLADLPKLRDLLDSARWPMRLPNDLVEGGCIRTGYDAELDRPAQPHHRQQDMAV
jgi:DNA mismatch repair protein MutS